MHNYSKTDHQQIGVCTFIFSWSFFLI